MTVQAQEVEFEFEGRDGNERRREAGDLWPINEMVAWSREKEDNRRYGVLI
jgi:hypothetical protein